MAYYWKLNDYELRLVEHIYNEGGDIFVDINETLHIKDGDGFERVKSEWFENLSIFIYEVENSKIIQSLKRVNGARNS